MDDRIIFVQDESVFDLQSALDNAYGYNSGIIPKNTVYLSQSGGRYVIITQDEPAVRQISLRKGTRGLRGVEVKTYSLAFPHLVFIGYRSASQRSFHCLFSNQRVKSFDDLVYLPALPNSVNGWCCYPQTFTPSRPFLEQFVRFKTDFWNSTFSFDILNNGDYGKYHDYDPTGWNIDEWEQETRIHKKFIHPLLCPARLKSIVILPLGTY